MARNKGLSRRDFLAGSTKTAAALGALAMSGCAATGGRRAAGALPVPRKIGANDQIRVGVIGSGGQGTYDCCRVCEADNVICVALCDLAEFRLAEATARISKTMEEKGNQGGKIDHYQDYRHLLDRKDIDAVIIATPDHWHNPPFLAAVDAGKHIYQEKPFSYTIEQGRQMCVAAQKRPELTIQIGTQRRSGEHYYEARELVEQGMLGDVTYVRAYDCRNFVTARDPFAPRDVTGTIDWEKFQRPCPHKVKYDPWRYFAWRWFWDYAGGLVTDVGVHVMDIVHLLTGKDTPISAVCNGGVYGLKYWETPDVVNAVWDYGTHSVAFVSNFTNGWEGDGLTLFGTKATLEVRGRDIYIWEDKHRGQRGHRTDPIKELKHRGEAHQHNWIKCIRNGEKVNAPVELGFQSLLPSHMANLAYRRGTKITWDAKAGKIV